MVKCPFCQNCKIKFKELEEYKNNINKERNELLKENQKLKEKIKELEGNSKNKLKWSNSQKYQAYELKNQLGHHAHKYCAGISYTPQILFC